jgi:hypothetical protein
MQGIDRTLEARGLAVPNAEHPVVFGARESRCELTSYDGRYRQVLVLRRKVDHPVLLQQLRLT